MKLIILLLLNLAVCLPGMAAVAYDRINVTSSPYNAVPNDGLDDTVAINTAIAAGTSASRSIYFPPGTYNFIGLMTVPANKSYRFYGDGQGVSTILFSTNPGNPTAGINAPNMGTAALNVDGLTLQANSINCGTAINASFNPGAKFRTAAIQNVQIIGSHRDGVSGTYWTKGIYLNLASNTVIDKVHISGNKNVTQQGISWVAPTNDAATGLEMSNLEVKWCNSAFLTNGHVEGIYLSEFEFTSCGRAGLPAVYLFASQGGGGAGSIGGAAVHLVNGLIDSIGNGLSLENFILGKVSNVSFRHTGPEITDGTMLVMTNVTDVMVTENSFYGTASPNAVANENGVLLIDAHSVRVAGNNFSHMQPTNSGTCIGVLPASTVVRITDNLFSNVRSQYHVDASVPPAEVYFLGNNP